MADETESWHDIDLCQRGEGKDLYQLLASGARYK